LADIIQSNSISRSPSFLIVLQQWFSSLLELVHPASFIGALAEPFVIGKIKYDFFKTKLTKLIGLHSGLRIDFAKLLV